jgi:hypothetical protein
MNFEEDLSDPLFTKQIVPTQERRLQHRPRVEMDGVAAAWLLFQFSRQSKEQRASHTIRTILPTGDLKVVNIEVECMMTKKGSKGSEEKLVPAGLPGAFAQDIFIGLMDHLVNQIRSTHVDLIARAQTTGLKGVSLPPSCTEVYFRNKDLAHRMQISEKNARITEALEHLHKTHIKIRGCIYRNGKEESVTHDTYYIPALTAGKRLRGGMEKTEWQRAKFDDVLVREILHGYIAQMDTDKLLKLPSGAPRKLYSLLAAKVLERKGSKNIVITNDEIINTLRIKRTVYKKLAKRYFQNLIEAGIVSGYSFAEHRGIDVVVFELPTHPSLRAAPSSHTISEEFFKMFEEVAKKDPSLQEVLNQPNLCDLDVNNLASLLRNHETEVTYDGKLYPKVILWADMLIYNRSKGQYIKSMVALLKTLLKKNQEPTVAHGFKPMDQRYKRIEAVTEAQKSIERAQKLAHAEDQRVKDTALHAWKGYNETQKERIKQAIQELLFEATDSRTWQPQPNFYEFRALEVIESAINHGLPTGDVTGLLKWYKERSRNPIS